MADACSRVSGDGAAATRKVKSESGISTRDRRNVMKRMVDMFIAVVLKFLSVYGNQDDDDAYGKMVDFASRKIREWMERKVGLNYCIPKKVVTILKRCLIIERRSSRMQRKVKLLATLVLKFLSVYGNKDDDNDAYGKMVDYASRKVQASMERKLGPNCRISEKVVASLKRCLIQKRKIKRSVRIQKRMRS